jgi:hypothetical protein
VTGAGGGFGEAVWERTGAASKAITAAAQARINYSFDGDWGNNPFWAPYDPYDYYSDSSRLRRMYSEEIRLSSDDPM